MKNIAVVGSSGHAKVVADAIEKQGRYNILGFFGPARSHSEHQLGKHPHLGPDENIANIISSQSLDGLILAIGDNFLRSEISKKIQNRVPNIPFARVIHPAATISGDVKIGQGAVILAGSVVGSSCEIGEHCILNTKSSLDHDSRMGHFSSLGPGVTTGGNCTIGDFSAIGLGANILNGIKIHEHSIVGAGSTVTKDIASHCVSYGVPAKPVRNRDPGDQYL